MAKYITVRLPQEHWLAVTQIVKDHHKDAVIGPDGKVDMESIQILSDIMDIGPGIMVPPADFVFERPAPLFEGQTATTEPMDIEDMPPAADTGRGAFGQR